MGKANKIDVKHDGKIVRFQSMKARVSNCCNFCGENIHQGDDIYIILTQGQFPNSVVHEKCTHPHPPFDKNDPFTWTAGELAKSWKEAQAYKQWFKG